MYDYLKLYVSFHMMWLITYFQYIKYVTNEVIIELIDNTVSYRFYFIAMNITGGLVFVLNIIEKKLTYQSMP